MGKQLVWPINVLVKLSQELTVMVIVYTLEQPVTGSVAVSLTGYLPGVVNVCCGELSVDWPRITKIPLIGCFGNYYNRWWYYRNTPLYYKE